MRCCPTSSVTDLAAAMQTTHSDRSESGSGTCEAGAWRGYIAGAKQECEAGVKLEKQCDPERVQSSGVACVTSRRRRRPLLSPLQGQCKALPCLCMCDAATMVC